MHITIHPEILKELEYLVSLHQKQGFEDQRTETRFKAIHSMALVF